MADNKEKMIGPIADMMRNSEVTLEDVAAHLNGSRTAHSNKDRSGVTVAEFYQNGLASMKPPSRAKHRGYIDVLVNGLPDQCGCMCAGCFAHKEKGSRTYTCPCIPDRCACEPGRKTDEASVLILTSGDGGEVRVDAEVGDQPWL